MVTAQLQSDTCYDLYETSGTIPQCLEEEFQRFQSQFPSSLSGWKLLPIIEVKHPKHKLTVGACDYKLKHIVMCRWLWDLNPPNHPDIIDTLRHEVAHALVGPGHKHGHKWQIMAVHLGCSHKHLHQRMREYTTLTLPSHLLALIKE